MAFLLGLLINLNKRTFNMSKLDNKNDHCAKIAAVGLVRGIPLPVNFRNGCLSYSPFTI